MTSIIGKFFRNFKGDCYYVINTSILTGHNYFDMGDGRKVVVTGVQNEMIVNYISLYKTKKYPFGQLWSQPLDRFTEIGRFTEIKPSNELYNLTRQYINSVDNIFPRL